MLGSKLVEQTTEKFKLIRQHLLTAQSRQMSYADKRRRPLEFKEGDHVFLKTKLRYGIMQFVAKESYFLVISGRLKSWNVWEMCLTV